jgi:hypothetical protein
MALAEEAAGKAPMSPDAKNVPQAPGEFGPDPEYADKPYNIEDQLDIYGGKFQVTNPRPMLELGRPMYQGGPLRPSGTGLGSKNPTAQAFSIYGDWRTAFARNIDRVNNPSVLATRLNLDVDWKLTATERFHAFFRPLDDNGKFTRCEFQSSRTDKCTAETDAKAEALFFEGDLGAMMSGWTNRYQSYDLPFAVGKIPLLFQNGIWLEDAFTGIAATLPGRNSPGLSISNMDVTFFAGFDDVNSAGVRDAAGKVATSDVNIYGVTAFIEANQGFWEMGYAYTDPKGALADQSYHNVGIAFTRRYGGWLSNTVRVIHSFGQDRADGLKQNADGTLYVIENSLVTRKPLTLVPYFNAYFGSDRPQSVARAADAGGILKNTGINFETDGLTGFPKLDDTANNTWGGALGVEYLFDLKQQIVFEVATVQVRGDTADHPVTGRQNAIGVRYQRPLDQSWIFRTDAVAIDSATVDNIYGIRFELRYKF